MKILSVFIKSMREQIRDYWVFIMTISTVPFFVFIYWAMFGGGSTSYQVIIINNDKGLHNINCGEQVIESIKAIKYDNGNPILNIEFLQDRQLAEKKIKNRNAAALLIIPENFSFILDTLKIKQSSKPFVTLIGDISNPQYSVAAIFLNAGIEYYHQSVTKQEKIIGFKEELLGQGMQKSEFETYIPGLIIFSVIMLIYTIGMLIVREVESGTIKRIKLTSTSSFEYLTGVSLSQVVVGLISLLITFGTAKVLGFRSEGSLFLAMIILLITIVGVIGIGLIFVSFAKTAQFVLTAGTFPLFILMFFTGAAFPLPRVELFDFAGRTIALNDILPPTLAVIGLNKVLSLGADIHDVFFEISALTGISLIYFALGVWLFNRKHFRNA